MPTSNQTQRDLKSILEIIDQRIHEITGDPALQHEVSGLVSLREAAEAVMG